MFGSRVCDACGAAFDGGEGSDVDDTTFLFGGFGEEMLDHAAHDVEGSVEIYAHDAIPHLIGDVGGAFEGIHHAGDVAGDVDGGPFLQNGGNGGVDGGFGRDVAVEGEEVRGGWGG